jgi:hypothetical protein
VALVERLYEALDRSSLAGRIPAFEENADRWAELVTVQLATELEAQCKQTAVCCGQPLLLLYARELETEVEICQAARLGLLRHGKFISGRTSKR